MVWKTITFDEAPVSSPPPSIGVRYSNQGVLLPSTAQITSPPNPSKPHSGTKVLVSRPIEEEFDTQPLIIGFTYNVQGVSLYTGFPWPSHGPINITLEAFDDNDNIIARTTATVTGPSDIDIPIRVMAPNGQHSIKKVKLDARNIRGVGTFEWIDDLSLLSEGDPPILAKEPPNVYITSPMQAKTDTGKITISGDIYGEGMFPEWAPPELEISWPIDPKSTYPSSHKHLFTLNKDLSWTSTKSLHFSLPFKLSHFGENVITITASNAAGAGIAKRSIVFFPQAIEDEYNKKGGYITFGDFIETSSDGCIVAIYQNGAIHSLSGKTYSVLGNIFDKWKSLLLGKLLGCAISEEKPVYGQTGTFQDFVGGRIYSGTKGTYYVVEPFRDAIDKLNFVAQYGFPVTDPMSQNKQLLPLLWQKFETSIGGVSFISTMEVTTNNPLKLWIAIPDITGAYKAGLKTSDFSSRIPAVWYSFNCAKIDEPCANVGKPQSSKGKPYSDLEKACQNNFYPFGVDEWVSLDPLKITPFIGNVKSQGLAGADCAFTHECCVVELFSWGCILDGVDYCIKLVPDPGFENLLGGDGSTIIHRSVVHPNYRQETLEIEYEWCLVGYPFAKDPNDPSKGAEEMLKPGDKLFVAGRWISDCGCHPFIGSLPADWCKSTYRSEIHPPAVMINMHTEERLGQPTTVGEILYFDWWYPNEVVEVDIYPPPRPSPDYILSVVIPKWPKICPSDGGSAGIQYSLEPSGAPNHVHLKISGRPDIPKSNKPPKEVDGQLFHGYAPTPVGRRGPIIPESYIHRKSLLGYFEVGWVKL